MARSSTTWTKGNGGGKPKGAKNKKTQQWETFAAWFMSTGLERLEDEMSKLEGKDFVSTVKDLLEYFQPKLARTELTGEDGGAIKVQPILGGYTNEISSNDSDKKTADAKAED